MRKIAKIYKTQLNPTKTHIVNRLIGTGDLYASWRLLDRGGEVGIESLVCLAAAGELYQIPLTYRARKISDDTTLLTLEHGVLGCRWVSPMTKDRVAIGELLDTVLGQEQGALPSQREVHVLDVRGEGNHRFGQWNLNTVQINASTLYTCTGSIEIDGIRRNFVVDFPEKLQDAATYVPAPGELLLVGEWEENPAQEYVVATVRFP